MIANSKVELSFGKGLSRVSLRLPWRRIRFQKIFDAIIKELRSKSSRLEVELEVQLVKSPQMKKLNAEFRGKNKATDVLSFPSASKSHPLLGSIVIDLQTARKQAREYGHSLQREVEELFVHGVLHLLGYDHEKKKEAARMKKLELRLSRHLGGHLGGPQTKR